MFKVCKRALAHVQGFKTYTPQTSMEPLKRTYMNTLLLQVAYKLLHVSLAKACSSALEPKPYLEGQGDLVTRLILGIIGATIWVIGVINLLTKSP